MVLVGGRLGWRVTFALLRDDVDEHGTCAHFANVFQDGQKMVEVMAVDRPDIEEAHFLEQGAGAIGRNEGAAKLFGAPRFLIQRFRQMFREGLHALADIRVWARVQLREIGGHRADRGRDRHIVVVENDD